MRAAAFAVAVFAAAASAADPCSSIMDCTSCVNSVPDCGWCSAKVIYQDGTVGAQCVSPESVDPFLCSGIYSTEVCQTGYVCDNSTHECKLGKAGEGASKAECQIECIAPAPPGPPPPPGSGYACETSTGKCKSAVTWKGVPKDACEAACIPPTPPGPTPPTPTPAPARLTQIECSDSACSSGCQSGSWPLKECVQIGGVSIFVEECFSSSATLFQFSSSDCSGDWTDVKLTLGQCVQSLGGWSEYSCA
eukprot:Hpha_TRINITY_DN16842_c2_g4::TRINITY_DN16842_c2_g4_i1::g.150168::m.150168